MTSREHINLVLRYLLCAGGVATLLFTLFTLPIRTDYGWISSNTGSRHEYTQWFFSIRSNERYAESPIEIHLRSSLNRPPDHQWVSYAGTGRNIFGMAVIRSHGSPGAVLDFSPSLFDHVEALPPSTKEEIAMELHSKDQKRIQERMANLMIAYLESLPE